MLTISSFVSTSLLHCFSLLSPFLYSYPFRNIEMHREISDCHFNRFFAEIQLKKRKLEKCFWAPEFGRPNRYTGLPNSLNMSLIYIGESELLKKNNHRGKRTRQKNNKMSDAKQVNQKDKMEHAEGKSHEYDDYDYHKEV